MKRLLIACQTQFGGTLQLAAAANAGATLAHGLGARVT
jgi:hypothetical protein